MRIRTVKPGFWENEQLASISEPAALLALALLNYADDEGYFRANEKLIKGALFPIRDLSVTIHGCITELSVIGFIRLFTGTDGREYGQIINFTKHQQINRPKPSEIKPFCKITDQSVMNHGSITDESLTNHGSISDASHPRARAPEWKGNGKGMEREGEGKAPRAPSATADPSSSSWIMDLWNQKKPSPLPQCEKWTTKRKTHAAQRLRDYPDRSSWEKAISELHLSDFCQGKNDRNWVATIDFLLERPDSITRLIEGTYRRPQSKHKPPPTTDGRFKKPDRQNYDTYQDYADDCTDLGFTPDPDLETEPKSETDEIPF